MDILSLLGFLGAGISTVALPAIAEHTGLAAGFAMMAGLYALAVAVLLAGRATVARAIRDMNERASRG